MVDERSDNFAGAEVPSGSRIDPRAVERVPTADRSSDHRADPPAGRLVDRRSEGLGDRAGETLRAAAEGDEQAWRLVVESYAPRVFALLRAQCGDSELAEEITQSTFCTLATKIVGYVEGGKFESWLFRIAVNRLRDELRRRGRHAVPTDDAVLTTVAGAAPSVSESSDAEMEERSALRAAIAKLSPADQRVVHLRHVGGLSFKQIAEAVDEPLGTVLARHHRALRKLRDLLGGAGGRSG